MALLLFLLNLALFACVTAGAAVAAWLGWKAVGTDHGGSGSDGGSAVQVSCIRPRLPGGFPTRRAGRNDLARSA
jgi:hypothetical protein